jgi:hypothetical protein
MTNNESLADKVAYAAEVGAEAEKLVKAKRMTPESKEELVKMALKTGREAETPATTLPPTVTPLVTTVPPVVSEPVTTYATPKRSEKVRVGSVSEMLMRHPDNLPGWTGPRLTSGKPFTYAMLNDFAWRFANEWMTDDVANVTLDIKTIGGLNNLMSLYCTTAYTVSRAVPSDKLTKSHVIKRCNDVRKTIDRISKMRPVDVVIPPDMLPTLSQSEINLMETSYTANKQVFVLEGLEGWIDALIDSGEYVNYKPLRFLKLRLKKLSSLERFFSKRFRDFEVFLQYAETNRIDIRDFGPTELRIFSDDFAVNDYKAKMVVYNAKLAFYEADTGRREQRVKDLTEERKQKVKALAEKRGIALNRANTIVPVVHVPADQYTKDVDQKERRMGISRAKAETLVPTEPTTLAENSMVDRMNAVSQLFADIGANFPADERSGAVENPLEGVHIAYEKTDPISYKLVIDDRKELKIDTDEIITIYRAIVNAPIKDKQYKRGMFILLRIIRETGARPSNVVWLRWKDFPEPIGSDPRKIDWAHAEKNKTGGKGAPETSYISFHLSEDIDAYVEKYKPNPEEYIAGAGIFPRQDTIVEAESGYRQIDHDVLSLHIRRLGRYTGMNPPILAKRLRKSFASLAFGCAGESLVAELTGDQVKTVKTYYKDVGGKQVQVSGAVKGKFSPAEIARKVFDKEYPTTGISEQYQDEYEKDVPR